MTVEEIKAKLPEAEVYELRPDCRYLLVIDRAEIPLEAIKTIGEHFRRMGIAAGLLYTKGGGVADAVRILEMKP